MWRQRESLSMDSTPIKLRKPYAVATAVLGATLLAGCNFGHRGDPLRAESFLAPRVIDTRNQEGRAIAGRAAPVPIDRSGPLYDTVGVDALETEQERKELEEG